MMTDIDPTIKAEKMTTPEPDMKMCVHELGAHAFRVPSDQMEGTPGQPVEDWWGTVVRVIAHDTLGNPVSVDLTFDEDMTRALCLSMNEACSALVDHKYGHMTTEEMSDKLADELMSALVRKIGLAPLKTDTDKKED